MGKVKILKASAGSGKTYRLAYEYIRSVIDSPQLYRHILAVTFTNKATEEMKQRIVGELNALANGSPSGYMGDLERDLGLDGQTIRRRAVDARTKILHDYSRFTVLTIDKFFQRIIRSFIKELGIDLNFNLELQTDSILDSATDRLIDLIYAPKAQYRPGARFVMNRRTVSTVRKFKDADGYYCGARLLLMGVTFSTATCSDEEAPTNYDGFLGESFKDQIVMTDPTGSGSTKALVYALTNDSNYGWEYFEKLKEQGVELQSSSGSTNTGIASGAYKLGFGVDYNTKNLMAEGSPLGWHDTKDIVAVPCPIGIPKGAPQEELAQLLYDFILDPEGGQAILTQYNITPIVDGVALPDGMMKASEIANLALPIDWVDLAAVSNELLDRFDAIFKN